MRESHLRRITLPSVIVSVLIFAYCGESPAPGPAPPSVDVTGTWFFKHLSGGVGGQRITATLSLTQDGSKVSGTHTNTVVVFTGCGGPVPVCVNDRTSVPDGTVEGSVTGTEITLEFNADDLGQIDRFEGTMSGADSLVGDGWTAKREDAPPSTLEAPTVLEGRAVETQTGFGVELSWNDNSNNETGFAVAQSCDGQDFELIGAVQADAVAALVPPELITGTVCSYFVLAFVQIDNDDYVLSPPSNTVTVTVPQILPALTGLSPSNGPIGTQVTLRGSNLSSGGADPSVVVGGVSGSEFVQSVSDSAITLLMPNAGASGGHLVIVTVSGRESNPLTWNQQGNADPTDPGNDDPASSPAITLPLDAVGSFVGGDVNDFYGLVLPSETTVTILLDWNATKDLDVYVTDAAAAVTYCNAAGATYDKPERVTCTLPAGTYYILVQDFDARPDQSGDTSLVSYRIKLTSQ